MQPTLTHRRCAAVLFADICGFTRMVETLEPETVYETVRPLLDDLVDCVHRYDGEIQQVLGDGFMAVFGLHGSEGDEVERAVQAGLAMLHGTGGGGLAVHVGVEVGDVLVTGSWEPACFGVWGHAVNLAQRLCDLAGPGELMVGPAAATRAGRGMDRASTAVLRPRGIDHPVAAQRLTAELIAA